MVRSFGDEPVETAALFFAYLKLFRRWARLLYWIYRQTEHLWRAWRRRLAGAALSAT